MGAMDPSQLRDAIQDSPRLAQDSIHSYSRTEAACSPTLRRNCHLSLHFLVGLGLHCLPSHFWYPYFFQPDLYYR